jgi:hypothetical protein
LGRIYGLLPLGDGRKKGKRNGENIKEKGQKSKKK